MSNRAFSRIQTVFLDRDGVVNRKMPEGQYVVRPDQLVVLPGVPQAIRRLNDTGLLVTVVTNQRGVARGLYTLDHVAAIHLHLAEILAQHGAHLDGVYVCPHDDRQCNCRKPGPGLFERAMREFPAITVENSVVIGDALSDVEAGRSLGMKSILILGAPEHRKPGVEKALALADSSAADLSAAAGALLDA